MNLALEKEGVPAGFPVGARILERFRQAQKAQRSPSMRLMSSPQVRQSLSRRLPRYEGPQSMEKIRQTVGARGTLSEFMAAKSSPRALQSTPPTLETQKLPPTIGSPEVHQGTGTVRDAEIPKAASVDLLLPLQKGMQVARNLIWKHMSKPQRAKYLLLKTVDDLAAPASGLGKRHVAAAGAAGGAAGLGLGYAAGKRSGKK